jgi:hypothetical protein
MVRDDIVEHWFEGEIYKYHGTDLLAFGRLVVLARNCWQYPHSDRIATSDELLALTFKALPPTYQASVWVRAMIKSQSVRSPSIYEINREYTRTGVS